MEIQISDFDVHLVVGGVTEDLVGLLDELGEEELGPLEDRALPDL